MKRRGIRMRRPYQTRRTDATIALMAGVNPSYIRANGPSITKDVVLCLCESGQKGLVAYLDGRDYAIAPLMFSVIQALIGCADDRVYGVAVGAEL